MPVVSTASPRQTQFGIVALVWTSLAECPLNSVPTISHRNSPLASTRLTHVKCFPALPPTSSSEVRAIPTLES